MSFAKMNVNFYKIHVFPSRLKIWEKTFLTFTISCALYLKTSFRITSIVPYPHLCTVTSCAYVRHLYTEYLYTVHTRFCIRNTCIRNICIQFISGSVYGISVYSSYEPYYRHHSPAKTPIICTTAPSSPPIPPSATQSSRNLFPHHPNNSQLSRSSPRFDTCRTHARMEIAKTVP